VPDADHDVAVVFVFEVLGEFASRLQIVLVLGFALGGQFHEHNGPVGISQTDKSYLLSCSFDYAGLGQATQPMLIIPLTHNIRQDPASRVRVNFHAWNDLAFLMAVLEDLRLLRLPIRLVRNIPSESEIWHTCLLRDLFVFLNHFPHLFLLFISDSHRPELIRSHFGNDFAHL